MTFQELARCLFGLVFLSGCAAQISDPNCPPGSACFAGSATTCTTSADCAGNQQCGAAGVCIGAPQAGVGAQDGLTSPLPARECGAQRFSTASVPANFFIVLDHSGSMSEEVGGAPKWTTATAAVRSITQTHQSSIRFGLQLFSNASRPCDPGKIDLDIGDNQAAAISAVLPPTADGDRTPVAGALSVAATAPGLKDTTRANNVLIITDGKENCGGNPVARVQDLFKAGIRTYVVGFGGEVDKTNLSEMAVAGGTARPGQTAYHQADDAASLDAAFNQIARGALGCDLQLNSTPADPFKVFVYVNGAQQPRDGNRQNGWDYEASSNRVVLYGTSCTLVSNDPSANVDVVYGCPDESLVEKPGDGAGPGGNPAGGACSAAAQCASGLCQANGTCLGSPADAPCSSNGQCTSGVCNAGFCEGNGAGNPNGEGRPGGAVCTSAQQCESAQCENGFCSGGSLPGGAACDADDACASNNCEAGTCQSTGGFGKPGGAACQSDIECAAGQCSNGFCEAGGAGGGKPNGSACSAAADCLSGICTGNVCRSGGIF